MILNMKYLIKNNILVLDIKLKILIINIIDILLNKK